MVIYCVSWESMQHIFMKWNILSNLEFNRGNKNIINYLGLVL
jgi:hypothetical protein